MLSVVCWRWAVNGTHLFGREYVTRLYAGMQRHLRIPHQFYCVTDDPRPFDEPITIVPMDQTYADTPRCQRRMWHFARERAQDLGARLLCVDLDLVILSDITPLVDRPDPIVCWRVGYADVYTGAMVLHDAGALDGAWQAFRSDPIGFPRSTGQENASETAMLTHWIRTQRVPVAEWTERDHLVMWFGDGYERLDHHGLSPRHPMPAPGTRLVMFGGADKAVMDEGRYEWIRDHWIGNGVAA